MAPGIDATLHLPRILCLHGGGTSADIFQVQCRGIIKSLATTFRFVFVNGPFNSVPHPAIVPFFGQNGPFYRWLRWEEDHELDPDAARIILESVKAGMDGDEGDGPWVAVMGFSQGAKVAASMLWANEKIKAGLGDPFRFGVIIAGRAPIVVLDPDDATPPVPHTAGASDLSSAFDGWPTDNKGEHAISTPTLHVHGLQDPGMELHRVMANMYCKDGTAKVVEWDGDHRLPIRPDDVQLVVKEMLVLARDTGVPTEP